MNADLLTVSWILIQFIIIAMIVSSMEVYSILSDVCETMLGMCECTENVRKDKDVCTIFAVLITFYVNLRLNGFYNLMVFTIIVFQNKRENISKENSF